MNTFMRKAALLFLLVSSIFFDAKPMDYYFLNMDYYFLNADLPVNAELQGLDLDEPAQKRHKEEPATLLDVDHITDWSLRMALINSIYDGDFENNYADLTKLIKYIAFPDKRIYDMVTTRIPLKIKLKETAGDQDLKKLVSMFGKENQIVELDLCGCKQIEDFAPLAGLFNLRKLDLYDCWRIATFKDSWGELKNLQELNLAKTYIRGREMEQLAKLFNLQKLNLSQDSYGDLANLPRNLRELNLSECKGITDVELADLAGLTNLQKLNLNMTDITAAGAEALQRQLPDLRIIR